MTKRRLIKKWLKQASPELYKADGITGFETCSSSGEVWAIARCIYEVESDWEYDKHRYWDWWNFV